MAAEFSEKVVITQYTPIGKTREYLQSQHREINKFSAKKICIDLEVADP